jgi:hypothetical protein
MGVAGGAIELQSSEMLRDERLKVTRRCGTEPARPAADR